jgi:uncharacterized membrane protein (UPF0127 family)
VPRPIAARVALVTLVPGLAALGCSSSTTKEPPAVTPSPATGSAAPAAARADDEPRATVYLATAKGEIAVRAEVVASEATIERGLMFREHLALDGGMLFLMGHEQAWTFWMRNTLIPLDMIFIAKDLTIAGIVERAEPRTESMRQVAKPSLYVLEVNGGWTSAHGVVAGAKVRFEGVEAAKR